MAQRKKSDNFNFEKSLQQLDKIVAKMEQGDIPLEQSLKHFEEGIELIRLCQKALSDAEQKVEILTQEQGKQKLKPYQSDE